jgi:hypothetical protein
LEKNLCVNSKRRRRMKTGQRKKLLNDLAKARLTLGDKPQIRVVAFRSGFELASYENNRVNLGVTDWFVETGII